MRENTLILKNGVIGFTAGDLSLERDWDELLTTFKKNCYAAVQHVKGQVLNWYEPDIDISYAHAHVNEGRTDWYNEDGNLDNQTPTPADDE